MLLRLDKIISSSGLATRSEVKRLVKQARVTVDGVTAAACDMKCDPEKSEIRVDGELLRYSEYHYIMMHKPAGVLSATEDGRGETVLDLLDGPAKKLGLFPVGRLDKDAEGLLILTDDGEFCHKVISPKSGVVKKYYVETENAVPASACAGFENGMVLPDGFNCLPAKLELFGENEKRACVYVCEGKFHQVKRMMAAVGCPVTYLKRLAEGGLELDASLGKGQWRELTEAERISIFEPIRA
ncbi:MAG: pseudouridine synthase [Clostridiales bacterium]|nr:pseudouridine synthase [Clostridiales bacterium]